MEIDLNTCKPGDKLISVHGLELEYVGRYVNFAADPFPHRVRYPDGSLGHRTDDGQVLRNNKMPEDHDIVAIIRRGDDETN